MIRAIVAVDKKWGIGRNNGLLFSLPEDMKFFRTTTTGKTVVMGYNTLRSFPGGKPLKNRINVVLCPEEKHDEGCVFVKNMSELFAEIEGKGEVYVIGGAMTYHSLLPYCDEALVTKVDADGDATVFFDNLDALENWSLESESDTVETNGYKIKFTKYVNSDVKKYNSEKI